jgi:hypothetical protein
MCSDHISLRARETMTTQPDYLKQMLLTGAPPASAPNITADLAYAKTSFERKLLVKEAV